EGVGGDAVRGDHGGAGDGLGRPARARVEQVRVTDAADDVAALVAAAGGDGPAGEAQGGQRAGVVLGPVRVLDADAPLAPAAQVAAEVDQQGRERGVPPAHDLDGPPDGVALGDGAEVERLAVGAEDVTTKDAPARRGDAADGGFEVGARGGD